jgi:hypothetical protein
MAKRSKSTKTNESLFAHIRVLAMRRAEVELERDAYVDSAVLAAALRETEGSPLPPKILDYLCCLLEGKVSKPKGRRPLPVAFERRQTMLMRHHYERYRTWLQARKKRYGHLNGWSCIRDAAWWQGPPHERAARMVADRWSYGTESWRTVRNRISSRK